MQQTMNIVCITRRVGNIAVLQVFILFIYLFKSNLYLLQYCFVIASDIETLLSFNNIDFSIAILLAAFLAILSSDSLLFSAKLYRQRHSRPLRPTLAVGHALQYDVDDESSFVTYLSVHSCSYTAITVSYIGNLTVEVKQLRVRLVAGWVTDREYRGP